MLVHPPDAAGDELGDLLPRSVERHGQHRGDGAELGGEVFGFDHAGHDEVGAGRGDRFDVDRASLEDRLCVRLGASASTRYGETWLSPKIRFDG